jgi:hypothetical protein
LFFPWRSGESDFALALSVRNERVGTPNATPTFSTDTPKNRPQTLALSR